MVLPTRIRGYAGGRAGYNQGLHHSPLEQDYPIYCNLSNIGVVSGGVAAPKGMSPKAVVESGGHGLGGHVEGVKGSRG